MLNRSIAIIVFATAGAFSATAVAQAPGNPGGSGNAAPRASTATGSNADVGGSGAFSGWLSDFQSKNNGRITRQQYMDEVGRRWDQTDTTRQGLTTDQINRTYGYGGSGAGSGSGAAVNTTPGNMGPQNVKK